MTSLTIGISGVAGAGKDTFAAILASLLEKRGYSVQRFALAGELKEEVADFSCKHYGIDPLTCSREEKELIRPLLITHGCLKRRTSKGRYWVEKLNDKILEWNSSPNRVSIITDIRFSDFEADETHWLQEELKGVLVHLSLYLSLFETGSNPSRDFCREFKKPNNAEEERNDPILLNKANYKCEWEQREGSQEYILQELIPYVEQFITWLIEHHRLNANPENKGDKL